MMPSRGAQLGSRAIKATQYRSVYPARAFSSSTSCAFIQSRTRPTIIQRSILEQKRSISWNPTTWWPSNNETKPFSEIHSAASSSATPATNAPASTPSPAAQAPAAQSTVSQTNAPAPIEQATPAAVESSPLSNLTEVNTPDVSTIPLPVEEIGYLKSLGLEYSYGPTALVEWLLEHIHVYTGLPWWGSIAITAALIRLSFTPLLMKTSDNQARMSHIQPELNRLNRAMMTAYRAQDNNATSLAKTEMQNLRLRAGVSFQPMILNFGVNMVFAIASLKLLRAMIALPVPGFLNGGALWFTDLTVADPYYLLPLMMAGTIHGVFRFGADPSMQLQNSPGMRKFMLYGLPGIVFFSMAWFSAALNLWFASAGVVSITVGKLLQNPAFRDRFGLMQPPPPGHNKGGGGMMSIFNQDDADAPKKTIDVENINKSSIGGVEYQAPRVKSTSSATTTAANGASNNGGRKMYKNSAYGASTASASAAASIAGRRSGPSEEEVQPAPQPEKGLVDRFYNSVTGKLNDFGDAYNNAIKKYRRFRGQTGPHNGSARNKDYLKRAEEYEKRYQKSQEMKKQR
ncbi:60Kd inner membrane protein-domain-containing protein [Elsinoe ampelina]|uniref:60Kd inner membrane protein-domain-containing protein n=1 Tax=Elsinoe ampelina TaxID=302913 RepID=A0A6A6G4A7_9PEZI|nr:60Kd inner membrane protein-domain-containing protein [Elsinoe ampelina]